MGTPGRMPDARAPDEIGPWVQPRYGARMTTAQGAPDIVMSGPARFGRLLLASAFLAGALVGLLGG